jgi:hypothetical protein
VSLEVADVGVVVKGEVAEVICVVKNVRFRRRRKRKQKRGRRTIALRTRVHHRRVFVCEAGEVTAVLLRVSLLDVPFEREKKEKELVPPYFSLVSLVSPLASSNRHKYTHLPLLTSKSCKLSSWLEVMRNSPLVSKEREVNCFCG